MIERKKIKSKINKIKNLKKIMEKKPKKSKVIYVSFNLRQTYFAIGLEDGFEVHRVNPLERIYKEELGGGIGIVEMLDESNILGLVGGGKYPIFDSHKVVIWDQKLAEPVQEYRLESSVKAVKMRENL